jgi:hypothetical protein
VLRKRKLFAGFEVITDTGLIWLCIVHTKSLPRYSPGGNVPNLRDVEKITLTAAKILPYLRGEKGVKSGVV